MNIYLADMDKFFGSQKGVEDNSFLNINIDSLTIYRHAFDLLDALCLIPDLQFLCFNPKLTVLSVIK